VNGVPPGFHPGSRARNLDRLKAETFDILIVGGGINGAGIARDLALRSRRAGLGLNIALVDKRHFSSGTSGRNSQLIHGGLRYLKYFEFDLVREALEERRTLLQIAPHLVEPLPMLLPFYSGFDRYFYGAGLCLYDWLAGEYNIGRRRYLRPEDVASIEPGLTRAHMHSAAIYFDAKVNSARLTLENLFDASRLGVAIANYTEAGPWTSNDDVPATEQFSGERFTIRAKRIVDARGPWEDSGNVRLVRGSHIIVPGLNRSENAIAYFGPDGRIIFVIPWGPGNRLSLVGTTDIDHKGTADSVHISNEEVQYLRGVVARLFPSQAGVEPVAAYSSLRPLIVSGSASATAASRSHKIWIENGVLKITGGKYTTYRSMSEEAVDMLLPGTRGDCETASLAVGGNTPEHFRLNLSEAPALAARYGRETEGVARLTHMFGRQTEAMLEAGGVVAWSIKHEMAMRLPDVMFVSTYWGHEQRWTPEKLEPIAREMQRQLGWSDERREEEISIIKNDL
jgi:glycerol-3-phosphate dehydrogenase